MVDEEKLQKLKERIQNAKATNTPYQKTKKDSGADLVSKSVQRL